MFSSMSMGVSLHLIHNSSWDGCLRGFVEDNLIHIVVNGLPERTTYCANGPTAWTVTKKLA